MTMGYPEKDSLPMILLDSLSNPVMPLHRSFSFNHYRALNLLSFFIYYHHKKYSGILFLVSWFFYEIMFFRVLEVSLFAFSIGQVSLGQNIAPVLIPFNTNQTNPFIHLLRLHTCLSGKERRARENVRFYQV